MTLPADFGFVKELPEKDDYTNRGRFFNRAVRKALKSKPKTWAAIRDYGDDRSAAASYAGGMRAYHHNIADGFTFTAVNGIVYALYDPEEDETEDQ